MKYILFIAAFLLSSLAYGQGTWNKSSTNNAWNRTKADSVAIVPRDTIATNNALLPSTGQPVGDYGRIQAKHGLFYFHDSIRNRRLAFYDDITGYGFVTVPQLTDSLNQRAAFYELLANKATTLSGANNTTYPTTLAVSNALSAIPVPTLQQVTTVGNTTTIPISINTATNSDYALAAINSGVTNAHALYVQADNGIPFQANIGINRYMQLNSGGRLLVGQNTVDDGSSAVQVSGFGRSNAGWRASDGTIIADYSIDGAAGGFGALGMNSNHPFIFRTNSTERIRIAANGNVGIGTITPVTKLVVSNGGADGLEFELNDVTHGNYMQSYNRSTAAYRPMTFFASRFNLDGGNVGIGTTAPFSKFQTDLSGSSSGYAGAFTAGEHGLFVGSESFSITDTLFNVKYGLSSRQVGGGGLPAMTILADGTVGIGTQSPVTRMVVSDNGANGFEVNPTSGQTDLTSINRNTSARSRMVYNASDHIFSIGKVGINSVPQSYLQVGGSLATIVNESSGASIALGDGDNTLICLTPANQTVLLPPISTCYGREYHIKKGGNNAFTVTIDPDGSETIDGSSTPYVISSFGASITLRASSNGWWIF